MERNIKIDAITLKRLKIGDNNMGVTIVTEADQVLFVMAFGAVKPKSKLFGGTNPFSIATWDLYYDPIKEFYRAKEVNVIEYNENLQLSISNFYTASLFSEIILKSQGSDGVFLILKDALRNLSQVDNQERVVVQFLLRLLNTQGLLPEFDYCFKCEREMVRESLYCNGQEELLCEHCITGPRIYQINPGMRIYSKKTLTMAMDSALKIGLEENSIKEFKKYLIGLIKIYCGGKLLTLNSANGLI